MKPAPQKKQSLRQRVSALRNLGPFLAQVWQTSPALTCATVALRLLREKNHAAAASMAQELDELNLARRQEEERIYAEAKAQASDILARGPRASLVGICARGRAVQPAFADGRITPAPGDCLNNLTKLFALEFIDF